MKLTVFSLQILETRKIPKLNHDFLGKFIAENTREDEIMSENEEFIEFEEEEGEEDQDDTSIQSKVPRTKVPSEQRITLFFRSTIGPGEKQEKLTVDPEMSVRELAETIGKIFALDPQDFHLSISGRTLDSDDVLSNYELEDGLEVLIIPVSTAG
ncbi:MAG: ubiquitin-like domain-containing protein [Candidatus Hodarchaeales archaeon]